MFFLTSQASIFAQATQLFNKADSIDAREEITWVGKGIMLLFRGDFDKAMKQFQTVLDQNGSNIPALLGRACILFSQGFFFVLPHLFSNKKTFLLIVRKL